MPGFYKAFYVGRTVARLTTENHSLPPTKNNSF